MKIVPLFFSSCEAHAPSAYYIAAHNAHTCCWLRLYYCADVTVKIHSHRTKCHDVSIIFTSYKG